MPIYLNRLANKRNGMGVTTGLQRRTRRMKVLVICHRRLTENNWKTLL